MKILFFRDDLPVSRLIQYANSCKWQHVAAVFGDTVIEARFAGVSVTTIDEIKSRGEYHIIDVRLPDEPTAYNFALKQVGKKYDFSALLGFKAMLNLENPNAWYCSELVAAIAKAGGTSLVRENLISVTPRDLWVLPEK